MTRGLALAMLLSLAAGATLGAYLSGPVSGPASMAEPDTPAAPRGGSSGSPDVDRGPMDDPPGPSADEAAGAEPAEPVAATATGYRDWARRDPAAFLTALPDIAAEGNAALTRADRLGDSAGVTAVRLASEADARLALEIAGTIDGDFGTAVRAAALEALAARDPESALVYIDGIGAGNLHDRLVAAIAAGFARHDLDAAVDWWQALPDRDRAFARDPLIAAVASVDLVRAIDLDQRAFGRFSSGEAGSWLTAGLESGRQEPARVADKLAGIQGTRLLADTMAWWVHRDTFGAIGWVMSQETVSATAIERMARTMTQRDSRQALALAAQFPPAVRARWIETVVGTLANYDPNRALDVLAQFEGEPFHAAALSNVAGAITLALGPETAAELAGSKPGINTALVIVGNWADSARAAEWALAIEDSTVRQYAVDMAVNGWARIDAAAARSWAAGLRDDELRAFLMATLCEEDPTCVNR